MEQDTVRQPRILILSENESILSLLQEFLPLEGYAIIATYTAQETLSFIEHEAGGFVVLIDNYQVSAEARHFAQTVFASPELHARVRVIGMAVQHWEQLIQLDRFIKMPFSPDDLLTPIAQACAELQINDAQ